MDSLENEADANALACARAIGKTQFSSSETILS